MNEHADFAKRAALELHEADINLQEAEYLAVSQFYKGAANRLYYAMFHGVSALFAKDGISCKTHKGSHIQFSKAYVFTGLWPEDFSKVYAQLQTVRESGDYDVYYDVSESQIQRNLPVVKDFLERVAHYKGKMDHTTDPVAEKNS